MRWLALALILTGCAHVNQGPLDWGDNLHSEARYVVESDHWNTAAVRIYCSTHQRVQIRQINMSRPERGTFDVGGCTYWRFTVETLASTEVHEFGPFTIQPGDLLEISIAPRLQFTSYMIRQ